MHLFISGIIFCAYASIGLFFFRFWIKARDRLFLWFAAAFWLLALERLLLLKFPGGDDPAVYLVRLAAFCLIICAIAEKNRGRAQ